MAISPLELRHIIESGFLPMQCRCSIDDKQQLSIELVEPASGKNLVAGGIPLSQLNTSRAIANLIAQLKSELAAGSMAGSRTTA